ncbi:hypothetical protein LJR045_001968 [Microbacterium sp. LjRoot45]|uniref:hypothetical protein n=1 Tax=Microbacterium sp. LjRoot45 TaxID=3342329 RepID=UPI003ED100A3
MVALTLALTACGTGVTVEDPDLTLYGAKAIAQEGETEVIAAIPEHIVRSVDQRPTGSLLSCTGERNYQWAGGTTVHVAPDTDLEAVIDDVAHAYSEQPEWEVTREAATDGAPLVTLYRVTTGGYLVSGEEDRSTIEIYSFSPCFHLPDGMSSRGGF